MKTKLEMAHEYAIALINSDCEMQFDKFIQLCWNYADAMQSEADKREKEEVDKQSAELRNILNLSKFKPLELQPDLKEWQPDWSQAPEWATHFFCERDEDDQLNGYFAEDKRGISIDFDIQGFDGYGRVCSCKTFNYQGDWRESLRKRPE